MGIFFRKPKPGPIIPKEPVVNQNDPHANMPKSVKLVLVGDATVGKSCMIVNYQQQVFDENYEPNVLDVFRGPKQFEKKQI